MYRLIKIKHSGFPQTAWYMAEDLVDKEWINFVVCDKLETEIIHNIYVHRFDDYYDFYINGVSCRVKMREFSEGDVVVFKKLKDFEKNVIVEGLGLELNLEIGGIYNGK